MEIKARSKDFANQQKLAEKIFGRTELLNQEDIFFRIPEGRLKLRILGPNQGELISYSRPEQPVIKQSTYEIFRTTYPEASDAAQEIQAIGLSAWLCPQASEQTLSIKKMC